MCLKGPVVNIDLLAHQIRCQTQYRLPLNGRKPGDRLLIVTVLDRGTRVKTISRQLLVMTVALSNQLFAVFAI